jgi:hypothetical protein
MHQQQQQQRCQFSLKGFELDPGDNIVKCLLNDDQGQRAVVWGKK